VPPGPEARYGVHFLSSGPGVTPLLSPLAPTLGRMKTSPRLWWWIFANIAWFVIVPVIFTAWLSSEIDAQYAAGTRTSTDGDSISIPLAIVVVANGACLLALNAAIVVYKLGKKLIAAFSKRRTA
jgi:hypothetical protein